jgi:integrase
MRTQRNARRPRGTGSIIEKSGAYYGKWRIGDRQIKRRLGPIRKPGTPEGLTRPQAERRLRNLMGEFVAPPVVERMTVEDAAGRHLSHLEAMGRKPSTLRSYRSHLRTQILPRLGAKALERVTRNDAEAFVTACLRSGLAPKTTSHCLGLLHGIFEHAIQRGWANDPNPCKRVDRPKAADTEADIRFLDQAEVEALLRAVPNDDFGRVQSVIYLAATMTGMRQGELLALRWQDVDWSAQRIRVRRNLVRGEFGTPKTRRGSRSIPLADRLGGELDRLYQRSAHQADDDLVFSNPHTGNPLNGHALLKSYQRALKAAGVRQVRFHDLRHTFGTRMAAAGVPMRTLQEWMGHRDFKTTLIYADYAPGAHEVELVNEAFRGTKPGTKLSKTEQISAEVGDTKALQIG